MLNAMTLENDKNRLEKAMEENNKALFELLDCLGQTGKRRISLFIERTGEDGQMDTRRL